MLLFAAHNYHSVFLLCLTFYFFVRRVFLSVYVLIIAGYAVDDVISTAIIVSLIVSFYDIIALHIIHRESFS